MFSLITPLAFVASFFSLLLSSQTVAAAHELAARQAAFQPLAHAIGLPHQHRTHTRQEKRTRHRSIA